MRSTSASRAVRNSTGVWMPRARNAWQRSRPSVSGSPISITSRSRLLCSTRASASAPVATAPTSNPSSRRPLSSTLRSSSSSSTTRIDQPRLAVVIPREGLHRARDQKPVRSDQDQIPSTNLRRVSTTARRMLNKVPEVTLYFWVIKVLCTTVGETASDYLSDNVGLGLTKTTFITGTVLIAVLVAQFRVRKYLPLVYWTAVVLISVVGTQITDNLTDNLGVSLVITTAGFSIVLALAFAAWYASERTLSIHTIFTTRREAFYW